VLPYACELAASIARNSVVKGTVLGIKSSLVTFAAVTASRDKQIFIGSNKVHLADLRRHGVRKFTADAGNKADLCAKINILFGQRAGLHALNWLCSYRYEL
jgi:hypothetical protein